MLDQIYKKALKLSEPGRPPEIRPSSMPFCPTKFLLKNLEYLNNNITWDYFGDFFCDIGTSIHSTLQKWLPRGMPGVIVGNWYCKHCNTKLIALVGPVVCNCGHMMTYHEFTITFKDASVRGHTDGILLDYEFIKSVYGFDPSTNPKKVNKLIRSKKLKHKIPAYILEYKSSNFWFIKNAKAPKNEHRCQATIYTSAFKKSKEAYGLHGIDLVGFIIKYYARENPNSTSSDFIIKVDNDKMYKVMCKIVNLIHAIIEKPTKSNVREAYDLKPCERWPVIYEKCEFESICKDYEFKHYGKDWLRVIEQVPSLKIKSLSLF